MLFRSRGVTPGSEPFDDSADYRMRVQHGQLARGAEPPAVRYRFSTTPLFVNGRYRVRFPPAPERLPIAADVTVTVQATLDVDIAGTRTQTGAGVGKARGRASTRGGWEVSWSPREPTSRRQSPRDRKSTRLNSSHLDVSRMPSSA